ncbi:hypothetical protein NLI96_g7567 [Meripilus lineatus]|uniref:Uncharacterized protein n=1 Tax=Meripilus lineatus TaxID=2056292 RepID=A0AAD5UYY7_9APHY|nr:hypothetical protein NLI96_g7567 [Physisporinus lineatus]
MAIESQIKFTSYGIPYISEFDNVRVRRKPRSGKPPVPPKDPKYLQSTPPHSIKTKRSFKTSFDGLSITSLTTASSETLASAYSQMSQTTVADTEGEGFYIRFKNHANAPKRKLTGTRLASLRYAIEVALVQAKWDAPDGQEVSANGHHKAALYTGSLRELEGVLSRAGLCVEYCPDGPNCDVGEICALLFRRRIANSILYHPSSILGNDYAGQES